VTILRIMTAEEERDLLARQRDWLLAQIAQNYRSGRWARDTIYRAFLHDPVDATEPWHPAPGYEHRRQPHRRDRRDPDQPEGADAVIKSDPDLGPCVAATYDCDDCPPRDDHDRDECDDLCGSLAALLSTPAGHGAWHSVSRPRATRWARAWGWMKGRTP
jgi:hypothetical protein